MALCPLIQSVSVHFYKSEIFVDLECAAKVTFSIFNARHGETRRLDSLHK